MSEMLKDIAEKSDEHEYYLAMPEGLSDIGKAAYKKIVRVLELSNIIDIDYKIFYSPQEWKDRGELYGLESHLIIVHDGGNICRFFNLDYAMMDGYIKYEFMRTELEDSEIYTEQCTNWYSAVYEI